MLTFLYLCGIVIALCVIVMLACIPVAVAYRVTNRRKGER